MIEVHVRENFASRRLDIYIVDHGDGWTRWFSGDGTSDLVQQPENATAEYRPPFCSLPPDSAHALLGALSRHLGAVEHPQQLRADFDHIRRRHDFLVDHILYEATARLPRQ